ncbi:hypothetical protein IFM89_028875 [Coptis chinensis]|uniref:Nodulin-like domain-containing protein n=1 Tax=Coptis chinensis TaxID=261450 RepID=A0A835LG34_9MAGN|nr:hypothetical protein IFM89_028875 [Coptis chinensis]
MESAKGNDGVKIFHFAAQVVRGRWFMMFASFLIMSGAGASYVFGIYSSQIKKSLAYDQKTLNLLGFFKDLGAVVGVISGLMAEVTPTWFVLLVGAGMNFGGYFMIWLAVTNRISKPKVWHMCVYICMGANSQAFANTGVLVSCVKNFPESRGTMLGLLKGFTGLSGAIMIQIYLAVYGNDSKSLILFIGWLPAAISIFFVYTIRTIKTVRQVNETRIFYHYLYISVALALFIMVIIIIQKQMTFSHAMYIASTTVVSVLLFLPLAIAIREELVLWKLKKRPTNPLATISVEQQPELPVTESLETPVVPPSKPLQILEKPKNSLSNIFKPPERGEDYTITQGLLSIDMLIIFFSTFCGYGTNLTAIDNLGQIGESLGYPALAIGTFVSLVSIWNYCGRVFAGFVSEILLVKLKFPRPLMISIVLAFSCIGHMLIAFPAPGSLYFASLIIGFSYGAQLALNLIIISELFGLKHYATLFNWGQVASPLGSYLFNVRVTGVLYDKEALKQLTRKGMTRGESKELTCIGKECYRLSFIILAAVSFLGALSTLVMVMRTRKFYKGDIYKKFRDDSGTTKLEMASASSSNDTRKTNESMG